MKKKISIFLAGSKSLTEERNALKASVHELNLEYKDKGVDVIVETESYENHRLFPDNQTSVDKYIETKTDVFICILRDRIGVYTKRELATAVKAYNEKKIPEIIVFLNKDRNENSPAIVEIYNILRDYFGPSFYYVEYTDNEDLKIKVKSRVERFVRPVYKKSIVANKYIISTLFALMLLFSGLFIWSNCFNDNEKQSLLLIGGGSAINFIQNEQNDNSFLIDYPNSICAYASTKTAWKLLPEEFNRNKYQNKKIKYNTICLSADQIPRDSTLDVLIQPCTRSELMDEGRIIEIYLGEDPLVVYIRNNFFENNKNDTKLPQKPDNGEYGEITPEQLDYIIRTYHNSANVFSTSASSGTCSVYQEVLKSVKNCIDIADFLNKKWIFLYTEALNWKTLGDIEAKPYIVLGSENYFINQLKKTENTYSMFHIKKDKDYVKKQIHMYFVAFKEVETATVCIIPSSIRNFLKSFKPHNEKTKKNWEKVMMIIKNDTITTDENLIYSIPTKTKTE